MEAPDLDDGAIGYVYGIRRADGRGYRYVGITEGSVRRRFTRHLSNARQGRKTPFYDWLRREGEGNVVVDVLEVITTSRDGLGSAEIRWIANLRADGPGLLNLTDGGLGPRGVVWTDEQREAARRRSTGRPGVSRPGKANPFYGKSHTAEQRAEWRRSRKGVQTGTDNANYGKFGPDHPSFGHVMSEEQRRALPEARRGPLNPNYGKTASAETRAKRSAAQKAEAQQPA